MSFIIYLCHNTLNWKAESRHKAIGVATDSRVYEIQNQNGGIDSSLILLILQSVLRMILA